MKGELLFLGTGGSMGIPVIGCKCAVCSSDNPKNKRLRPSCLIRAKDQTLLIDAGPDLRAQALRFQIDHLDGVILTHCHHDHTAGVDDLRPFNMWQKKQMPILCSHECYSEMKERFSYMFQSHQDKLTPQLDFQILQGGTGRVSFCGIEFGYTSYHQIGSVVNGFLIGNLAFVTDIKDFENHIFQDLFGAEILVISALRADPSPVHLSIDQAIAFGETLKVKKTVLTHLAHEVEHGDLSKKLPKNVLLAYDGMTLEFQL
jgi:phosphoribosyl 1,2-cyclic phosphate phosphodiesterase